MVCTDRIAHNTGAGVNANRKEADGMPYMPNKLKFRKSHFSVVI